MKPGSLKSGFTLIEMLVVVAIIAILVSMVVGVTKRIDDQRKERLCRSTIALSATPSNSSATSATNTKGRMRWPWPYFPH